jgi:hypothetical protein
MVKNTCTCSSAVIVAEIRTNKVRRRTLVELDLTPLQLTERSLLFAVLTELPCPVNMSYTNAFKRVYAALLANPRACEILRAPIDTLTEHDLSQLYSSIEDAIERRGNKANNCESSHARGIFRLTTARLPGDKALHRKSDRSRFPTGRNRPPQKDGPLVTEPASGSLYNSPILAKFDTFPERNKKALDDVIATKASVLEMCAAAFQKHEELVSLLNQARSSGITMLPAALQEKALLANPTANTVKRLPPEQQLQLALHLSDRDEYHRNAPGPGKVHLSGCTALFPYSAKLSPRYLFEILLARHYLPKATQAACIIAIMTDTSWNKETVLDLRMPNVDMRNNKISLTAVKAKSNTIQRAELENSDSNPDNYIKEVAHPVAAKAVRLLMAHAEAVEKYTNHSNPPLVCGFNRHDAGVVIFDRYSLIPVFSELFALMQAKPFPVKNLRNLGAHIDFLSEGGNIFTTQALLGHSNANQTLEYLKTTLIHRLLEANTRRFMNKMAASILWACGSTGRLEELNISEDDIQPALFPASHLSQEKSVADEWFESSMTRTVSIGVSELRHCALQFAFYMSNFQRLISDNPRRFLSLHLPRVIFCLTLRRVILVSAHAGLFKEIVKELQ